MKKILYGEEIPKDKLYYKQDKSKQKQETSSYRVYAIDKKGAVKGFWIDNGKLYRDRISFINYKSFILAKKQAQKILQETSEICVSIEDTKNNKLYIIYKDKTEILIVKKSFKTLSKRQALKIAYKLTEEQGGATIYRDKLYYRIISYK